MAISITTQTGARHRNIQFPTHPLATHLLGHLAGIELGPSAHNHFDLPGSTAVATRDDYEYYKQYQVSFSGAYAEVDVFYDGATLPFDDSSQQYVLSSHVLEHIPDVVGAFREWERVLADGGLVFMIVPQRDAAPDDVTRPLSALTEIERVHAHGWTVNDSVAVVNGHCWVFTIDTLKAIIEAICPTWTLVEEEMPDTKVGNGFTLAYRVTKPASVEVSVAEAEAVAQPVPVTVKQRRRK